MLKGIEHYGIAATEPEKLTKWYCDIFNMRIVKTVGETTFFIADENGYCIEIYQSNNMVAGDFNNYSKGLTHTAIICDDFENDMKRLIEMGIKPAAQPINKSTLKLALFYDLEGNLFHIIQRPYPILK